MAVPFFINNGYEEKQQEIRLECNRNLIVEATLRKQCLVL